jgi:bacteriocin biosynthesis cyclodehydratase domain-containing protein
VEKFFLRPNTNIIPMENGIQLRRGDEEIVFIETSSVAVYLDILGKLCHTTTLSELVGQVSLKKETLASFIQQLTERGMLCHAGETSSPQNEIQEFFSHAPDVYRKLVDRTIVLSGHPKLVNAIAHCFEEGEIETRVCAYPDIGHPDVVVCAVESPDLPFLETVNQYVTSSGIPALFVDLSHGLHATVGPFYIPQEGSCYQCLYHRILENTSSYPEQMAYGKVQLNSVPMKGYGTLPAFRYLVAGAVFLETLAFLSQFRSLRTLCGAITIDFMQLTAWREPVWRIPWCKACGNNR